MPRLRLENDEEHDEHSTATANLHDCWPIGTAHLRVGRDQRDARRHGSRPRPAVRLQLLPLSSDSRRLDWSRSRRCWKKKYGAGRIPGAVAAIARHGRIGYLQAFGQADLQAGTPMETEAIFRIASMTKAITSAAVMQLNEEGKLDLDDPVDKYLPEFASPRVLVEMPTGQTSTVAAERPITIRHLLTHTSGLTYGWFGPESLDAMYRRQEIPDFFVPAAERTIDRIRRIANVPLKFSPGSNWEYGVSTDVLGAIIEMRSGLSLSQFLHERIFRPLKMADTHFYLPADKRSRLAALYTVDDRHQLRLVGDEPVTAGFLTFSDDYCLTDSGFYAGGSGLVSTTLDYLRFLQMLLNGGELDGVRILQPSSVAMMLHNQIGDHKIPFADHGDGFGFGGGVLTDRGADNDVASVGTFSWGGVFNTYFWVDPQEQLAGIVMTQLFPFDHLDLRANFKRLTYQALDDSGWQRNYWYQPGAAYANPHFNGRQLRVNAAEASVHPEFARRSEPRSSGMARVLIEEDLRKVRRADLYAEVWGGHPGTTRKRVGINGRVIAAVSPGRQCRSSLHAPIPRIQPEASGPGQRLQLIAVRL